MRTNGRHGSRRARGQALVELALAVPILLAVVLAIVEGAMYAFTVASLQNAVQEGGRLAALPGTASESLIQARVVSEASPVEIAPSEVSVSVNSGDKTFAQRSSGDRVAVAASVAYNFLTAAVFDALVVNVTVNAEYRVE